MKIRDFSPSRVFAALVLAAALVCGGAPRAEAQVFIGGPGFGAVTGSGLAVGGFSPYGWGGGYGASFYSSSYYGAPFVGYAPGGYGFGYNYAPYFGRVRGFALPPVVIPAGVIYGPGAVQQFLGTDEPLATPVNYNYNLPAINTGPAQAGGGFGVLAPGVQVPKAHVVASNDAARERAKKQLAIGDDWFRKQQYGSAASAYREAIRAAPDVADAYFHQAAVAVAQGRYEAAVDGLKTGLRISTAYVDGNFKFSTLYGDANKIARTAHIEALAQAATAQPTSDLYYLMGVMLFFDEQPRRAGPFFAKARELVVAGETWHIDVFSEILRRMDAAAGGAPQPAPVGIPPAAHPPALNAPAGQAPAGQAPRADADGREI